MAGRAIQPREAASRRSPRPARRQGGVRRRLRVARLRSDLSVRRGLPRRGLPRRALPRRALPRRPLPRRPPPRRPPPRRARVVERAGRVESSAGDAAGVARAGGRAADSWSGFSTRGWRFRPGRRIASSGEVRRGSSLRTQSRAVERAWCSAQNAMETSPGRRQSVGAGEDLRQLVSRFGRLRRGGSFVSDDGRAPPDRAWPGVRPRSSLADSPLDDHDLGSERQESRDWRAVRDWRTSSDADLRALGREAKDPDALARLVAKSLRRGQLPGVGSAAVELPSDLRGALATARVREGRCAWCAGDVHRLRSGERACCCNDCYLEVGALCLTCPKNPKNRTAG